MKFEVQNIETGVALAYTRTKGAAERVLMSVPASARPLFQIVDRREIVTGSKDDQIKALRDEIDPLLKDFRVIFPDTDRAYPGNLDLARRAIELLEQ